MRACEPPCLVAPRTPLIVDDPWRARPGSEVHIPFPLRLGLQTKIQSVRARLNRIDARVHGFGFIPPIVLVTIGARCVGGGVLGWMIHGQQND